MIQTFTLNKDRRRSDVLNSLIYRIPTKLLSNPVQPTAFSDDPALSTHRPLVIVTPSQSGESTASIILSSPETTTTQENLWVQTTMPTSYPTSSPSGSGLFPQTTFPNSTTTAAETSSSSSSSSSSSASLTTLTGTKTSLTSNPASVPTAFANAAAGLIALVGLAMAL
ncbi:hypothetical protein M440DRAFT_1434838 [Trichoderma longibrachiatum ATCC 18648]|uniref:Uncharacterized protein n=1 Tax=Trichoderma longibrachiatum ATCC 18648 TaxID=983965 RepID=A0A2T4CH74_TRILO|nr:hypothetical protein M440DRAFT_1434838 [Trichoderma longibrachiatum ATCC 18648]